MKRLSTVRKLCVLRHDRWLSALSSNRSLFHISPRFQFASISRGRHSLLGLRYISYSAVRFSPPPTPSLYRIQIA
jgi:hypothetical protein